MQHNHITQPDKYNNGTNYGGRQKHAGDSISFQRKTSHLAYNKMTIIIWSSDVLNFNKVINVPDKDKGFWVGFMQFAFVNNCFSQQNDYDWLP